MNQKVANTYQQANLFTANPVRLIIMCYDGAIGSLKLACQYYAAKEYEAKAKALQKAMDIIHELNGSLDMEKGGTIAANLRSLYLYMIQILLEGDIKKDVTMFNEVIRMLEELESAWKEIAHAIVTETRPVSYQFPADGMKGVAANQAWSV
jgi:flagellar secretion chaperone FliS